MFQYRNIIFALFLSFFSLPFIANAAVTDIVTTPEIPGPYEKVTAEVSGYLIDADRAQIYWYQDEQIEKQGIGAKTYEFYTSGIGEPTIIDVIIVTEQGRRIDKQLVVEPIEVDLLWEAKTYTPPFYKGKALPTYNSEIHATAIPNIPNPENTNFLYTWKEGYFNIDANSSGYKSNTFSTLAQLSPYRKIIDVEVVSDDRSKRAKKQVEVRSVEPDLVAYEVGPLAGIMYANTLKNPFKITQDEVGIHIEPFYFSQTAVDERKILYRWVANGTKLRESEERDAETYVFGRPQDGSGAAKIQVYVLNNLEWLQKQKTELSLYYE